MGSVIELPGGGGEGGGGGAATLTLHRSSSAHPERKRGVFARRKGEQKAKVRRSFHSPFEVPLLLLSAALKRFRTFSFAGCPVLYLGMQDEVN